MSMTTEEAISYLTTSANLNDVRYLAEPVLSDERFPLWTGASKPYQHHYGKGLLAVHTAEVAKIAATVNETMDYKVDKQKLYLSCLYHDFGKLWDYKPKSFLKQEVQEGLIIPLGEVPNYHEWEGTEHKREIYHIQRSAIEWNHVARKMNLLQEFTDDITHAILAHHGMPEWGSPVGPNNRMAWLVHLADNISARMYDCSTWDITRR